MMHVTSVALQECPGNVTTCQAAKRLMTGFVDVLRPPCLCASGISGVSMSRHKPWPRPYSSRSLVTGEAGVTWQVLGPPAETYQKAYLLTERSEAAISLRKEVSAEIDQSCAGRSRSRSGDKPAPQETRRLEAANRNQPAPLSTMAT